MHTSILDGVNTVIDDWVARPNPRGKPPYYRHKSNLRQLLKSKDHDSKELDGCLLCKQLYEKITSNWDPSQMSPSEQNWRWKPCLGIDPQNNSLEVQLERAIIGLKSSNWVNQVPVASGLCGHDRDKRRCIDLVRQVSRASFEFIELKCKSDNPLFASMEILQYGILYLFTRSNLSSLSGNVAPRPNMLDAKEVHLRVLAPREYYEATELNWIEHIISVGVEQFSASCQCGVQMDFRFDRFPDWFAWPHAKDRLAESLQGIQPAFPRGQ